MNRRSTAEETAAIRTDPHPGILVVDDETTFAKTLADILGTKGYRVSTAHNLNQALTVTRRERIDLAIIDLRLPGAGGIEVLERIRQLSPATEAVILTAHGSVDSAVRAMKHGAFGYVEKPYDINRLFLIIERALAHRGSDDADPAAGTCSDLLEQAPVPLLRFHAGSGQITGISESARLVINRQRPAAPIASLGELFREPDMLVAHLRELKEYGHARTELPARLTPTRWIRLHSYLNSRRREEAVALVFDATEPHRRMAEHSRVRQYFEAIFTNLAAGIAIIDSDYVVREVNPAFARFHGRLPHELVGRRCHDVIHRRITPCYQHGEICPIKNCLATGGISRALHRHRNCRDETRFMETTVAPLRDEDGTIVSFAAILTDVTAIKAAHEESKRKTHELERLNRELTRQQKQIRVQAEELRAKNAELRKANATKDEFLSMVSHELRTPLTSISEGINLVADGTLGPLQERQTDFLSLALRNARRLGDIINDLLDISKIEAGRMECTPVPLDLGMLLRETGSSFTAAARRKNLDLDVEAPNHGPMVYADERLVHRILSNLLSNALKFTDEGAIIITAHTKGQVAVVTVADTGIGIPRQAQSQVFERFRQAHRDGFRPPGTGLGLALTREMTAVNRGRIWFESEENVGTRFHFTLPLDTPEARLAAMLHQCRSAPQGYTHYVLLAAPGNGARLPDLGQFICRTLSHDNDEPAPVRLLASCSLADGRESLALVRGDREDPGELLRLVATALADEPGRSGPVPLKLNLVPACGSTDASELLAELRGGLHRVE